AGIEHDERAVAGLVADEDLLVTETLLDEHAARLRRIAEGAGPGEDIGEGIAVGVDGEALALARRHADVEILRIGGDAVDRSLLAPEGTADDAYHRAVIVEDLGDVGRLHVLLARRGHLMRRGQIRPELEAVHASELVALRHFLVQYAAAR